MPSQSTKEAVEAFLDGCDVEVVKSDEKPEVEGAIVVGVDDMVEAIKSDDVLREKVVSRINQQKNVVCFYHRDLDGITAGAVVKKLHPDAEMISINYGEQFPWDAVERASEVWMVDFCLKPFSDMEKLRAECEKVGARFVWIDHHKTAIDEAEGFEVDGLRREGDAGCELTWEFTHKDEAMPLIVKLAGRYDVWDHSDPMTLPVHYAMESAGLSPDDSGWSELFKLEKDGFSKMVGMGKTIMQYLKVLHSEHMGGFSFGVDFEGLNCVAANTIQLGTTQFDSVKDGYDAALRFALTPHGNWTCSMYALKEGVNVAEVCAKYGGGGHPGASGFQCKNLPFDLEKIAPVGDERAEAALKAADKVRIEPIFKADAEEKRYTLGVVYEPNDGTDGAPLEPDTQGDIMSAEDIENAQRIYMSRFQRIGRNHKSIFAKGEATLVDCFIVPKESDGLNIKKADGSVRHIRPGSWIQGVIWSEEAWKDVKGGVLNAWSVGGKGYRTPVKS